MKRLAILMYTVLSLAGTALVRPEILQAQEASAATLARRIGAIKNIGDNALTLTPDSGPDVSVTVQPNARILRIAPGAKDLKDATPVAFQDLQVGDRVRVRGQAANEPNFITAVEIVVMARTDLEAHRVREQQDWQKRGAGGLVSKVDPATATVTISVTGMGGKKEIAVRTTGTTVFRRYAPDSVKFDDAKPSTLAEIRPGDQLRARGQHTPDGAELTAEEVVTGSFRNVAGTVNSVDASAGTVNVQDLVSKKAVVVRITPESQLHKLPPELAQRIAMRLKESMPPGTPGAAVASAPPANGKQPGAPGSMKPGSETTGGRPEAMNGGATPGGTHAGGGDFQQILSRMPTLSLTDLHKGDALLIVATEGSAAGATAITMLSGVEPILEAAPSSQAMMLTPWSLGGAPNGEGAQ
ncbi:MAG: DUF5666 domain-containing protein [Candidatus Angelobacter sp.]